MTPSRWPLAGLRLHTPDLELRWPSLDDLYELADLAAAGVHLAAMNRAFARPVAAHI